MLKGLRGRSSVAASLRLHASWSCFMLRFTTLALQLRFGECRLNSTASSHFNALCLPWGWQCHCHLYHIMLNQWLPTFFFYNLMHLQTLQKKVDLPPHWYQLIWFQTGCHWTLLIMWSGYYHSFSQLNFSGLVKFAILGSFCGAACWTFQPS